MPRELGSALPISVGTAIPFESQVVTDKEKPDALWLNVRTLFRNYWASYPTADRVGLNEMIPEFTDELSNINGLCINQQIRPVFYIPNYATLPTLLPHALLKPGLPGEDVLPLKEMTDNQLQYAQSERAMMTVADNHLKKETIVVHCQARLPGEQYNAWIMTHYAIDLLSRYEFGDLKLLESHTGNVLGPTEWHTKISKNESYRRIPFTLFTMQVFGDRSNLFRSYSAKFKKPLLKLAEENNWNQLTVMTKIRHDLEKLEDGEIKELFKLMCRATLN